MNDYQTLMPFLIVAVTVAVVSVLFIFVLIQYNKGMMRKQQEILKASFQAQEQERTRIAEELHDDIGPRLSALKLSMEVMKQDVNETERMEIIQSTNNNLDVVIKDLRSIVRNLSSKYAYEKGLYPHLIEMKKQFEQSGQFKIELQIEDLKNIFGREFEVNLLRVLQELTNNSVKHSGCSIIKISAKRSGNQLSILYSDNGQGFDTSKTNYGLGLNNIETRIKMFFGTYSLQTLPGKGVKYLIKFDLLKINQHK